MGHLVNPLSFRLGIITFWKVNSLNYFHNNYNYSLLYFFDKILHSFLEWLFNYRWIAGFFIKAFKYSLKKNHSVKKRVRKKYLARRISRVTLMKLALFSWGRILFFNKRLDYCVKKLRLRLDLSIEQFKLKNKQGFRAKKSKNKSLNKSQKNIPFVTDKKGGVPSVAFNKFSFNAVTYSRPPVKKQHNYRRFKKYKKGGYYKKNKKQEYIKKQNAIYLFLYRKKRLEHIRKLKRRKLTFKDKCFIFRRFQRKKFTRRQRYLILKWKVSRGFHLKDFFVINHFKKVKKIRPILFYYRKRNKLDAIYKKLVAKRKLYIKRIRNLCYAKNKKNLKNILRARASFLNINIRKKKKTKKKFISVSRRSSNLKAMKLKKGGSLRLKTQQKKGIHIQKTVKSFKKLESLKSKPEQNKQSIFDKLQVSEEVVSKYKPKKGFVHKKIGFTNNIKKEIVPFNLKKQFIKFKARRLIFKFKGFLFKFFYGCYLKILNLKFRRTYLFRRKKKRRFNKTLFFIKRYFFPELSHIVSYRSGFFNSKVLLYFSNPIISKVLLINTKKHKIFFKKKIYDFNISLRKYIFGFKKLTNFLDLKFGIYRFFKLLLILSEIIFLNGIDLKSRKLLMLFLFLRRTTFVGVLRKTLRRFRRSVFFLTYIKLKRAGYFPFLFRLQHGKKFRFYESFSATYVLDFFKKRWGFFLNKLLCRFLFPMKINFKFIFISAATMTSKMLFNFFCKHLRKKRPLNRILNMILGEIKKQRLLVGFKILTAGRFTRKERALYKWIVHKQTPLSLYSARIDYFSGFFKSRFGVSSFKIWIFKK